jgi:RNA polymerase-binding transcription factor DksA
MAKKQEKEKKIAVPKNYDYANYNESNPAPRDPKVRYSDEDLEEFKSVILDAREDALDELSMLKDRIDDLNESDNAEESMIYSMHMGDQGSEAQEKEKTYAQIHRINEYIKKLDDALNRISEKTYGICRVCGILIAKERLLAVPITTLSASYKIRKECPVDGIDRIEARKS